MLSKVKFSGLNRFYRREEHIFYPKEIKTSCDQNIDLTPFSQTAKMYCPQMIGTTLIDNTVTSVL